MGAALAALGADGYPALVADVALFVLIAVVLIAGLAIWFARKRTTRSTSQPNEAALVETPAQAPAAEAPPTPELVETSEPSPTQESVPLSATSTMSDEALLLQPVEAITLPEATARPSFEVPPTPTYESIPRSMPVVTVPQFLEAVAAEGKLRRFSLDRPRLTIGRAPDNNIVIDDEFPGAASVADQHARIELRDAWVMVEAACPEAPIFVNGQQTGHNILRNGWRLTLGEVDLTFRTAGLGTAPLSELESESASPGARAPRPSEAAGFAPLPEGAVLMSHYIVLEAHAESPTRNTYVAESLQPVLRCPQCGFDGNDARQKTCRNCSSLLTESVPYYPHYHVKETSDEGSLSAERQLVGLSHPNALLPRYAFAETPYGNTSRYYIVEPESPQLAATLRVPQELPQVLEWTFHLAQGMAYLHNNGVSLGPIDLWRIAIEGAQARWVDFSTCEFVADSELATCCTAEVRALAEIAYYLITGKRRYDESIEISPPGVAMLFDRVLGGLTAPTADKFAEAIQAGLVEVRRPSSVDVRVGRLTDVGQVRQLNEDSLLTIEIGRVRRSISEPIGLYIVCDGMGGHLAGDVASGLAVQTIARKALAEVMADGIAENPDKLNCESWLRSALQEANQAVFGRRRVSGNDMGTTCVAALICGDMATIAHAGDSRCYLINERGITQLTLDHSLVQRLIQLGQLTPEEARVHPRRNVIYKNLGDRTAVEPDVATQKLSAGDRLLLCSDGLNTMLSDEQIQRIAMSANSPQEACRQLVEAANHAGGDDNISVIVVQMEALD